MTKQYESEVLASVHEAALGLAEAGVTSKRTLADAPGRDAGASARPLAFPDRISERPKQGSVHRIGLRIVLRAPPNAQCGPRRDGKRGCPPDHGAMHPAGLAAEDDARQDQADAPLSVGATWGRFL